MAEPFLFEDVRRRVVILLTVMSAWHYVMSCHVTHSYRTLRSKLPFWSHGHWDCELETKYFGEHGADYLSRDVACTCLLNARPWNLSVRLHAVAVCTLYSLSMVYRYVNVLLVCKGMPAYNGVPCVASITRVHHAY